MEVKQLYKDRAQTSPFYPMTHISAVVDSTGKSLPSIMEHKPTVVAVDGSQVSTINAEIGTYYVCSSVGTMAITLPTISDHTHVVSVLFNITTGATPAVTFTGGTGVAIAYSDGFALDASTEYEVNCLFNGTKWLVTATTFATA